METLTFKITEEQRLLFNKITINDHNRVYPRLTRVPPSNPEWTLIIKGITLKDINNFIQELEANGLTLDSY